MVGADRNRRPKKSQLTQLAADERNMIAHRLCLALGRWNSPEAMLNELTADEFEAWLQFYQLEPFGDHIANMRTARMCWATLQCHSKRKLKEDSFLFKFTSAEAPTEEQFRRKVDAAFGVIARRAARRRRKNAN